MFSYLFLSLTYIGILVSLLPRVIARIFVFLFIFLYSLFLVVWRPKLCSDIITLLLRLLLLAPPPPLSAEKNEIKTRWVRAKAHSFRLYPIGEIIPNKK